MLTRINAILRFSHFSLNLTTISPSCKKSVADSENYERIDQVGLVVNTSESTSAGPRFESRHLRQMFTELESGSVEIDST